MGLWLQGCARRCRGCFNTGAWDPAGGKVVRVEVLARRLLALARGVDGLSVSGGEPLLQVDALTDLLRSLRGKTDLSILIFTGFAWEEVETIPGADGLLALVDVLVAGPYRRSEHVGCGLIGSANQTVHLLSRRHTLTEMEAVPQAELIIRSDGLLALSGIGGEPLSRALVDGRTFRAPEGVPEGGRHGGGSRT